MIEKSNYRKKADLQYNPEDVNIRVQHFRVSDLVYMLDKGILDIFDDDLDKIDFWAKSKLSQANLFEGENELGEGDEIEIDIDMPDDLQRNTGLWNNVQKSRFIESLMIKLPIPVFYFDGSQKPWRVVDGLQRLHTIRSFIKNEFKLSSLEYLVDECNGKFFLDTSLPGYLKARVLDAEIIAYVINPGTPIKVKYNIFKRINTGGLHLNGQEIRNAFFHGAPVDLTKRLASNQMFFKATNSKISSRRMLDREYANRFIAFQLFDYKDYNGKMDLFLSEAMMELYERSETDFVNLEQQFNNSMTRAFNLFGGNAFYRPKADGEWGRQPNKALFDTLSWNLNLLNDDQFSKLSNNLASLKNQYFNFMNNNDNMFRSINDTTGSKSAVFNRFKLLNNFLMDFIQ